MLANCLLYRAQQKKALRPTGDDIRSEKNRYIRNCTDSATVASQTSLYKARCANK
jgi:hypothetical protein